MSEGSAQQEVQGDCTATIEGKVFPCAIKVRSDQRPILSDGRLVDCSRRRPVEFGWTGPLYHIATQQTLELDVRIPLALFGRTRAYELRHKRELLSVQVMIETDFGFEAIPMFVADVVSVYPDPGGLSSVLLQGGMSSVRGCREASQQSREGRATNRTQ